MSLAFFDKYGNIEMSLSTQARFVEADFSTKDGISRTSQAAATELDINKIMARVLKGGLVPTFNGQPFYGDVSDLGGLQDAIIKVQEADDLFMQYPAEIRERFENDPVNMILFLEDPANYDEALKIGLVKPRPVVQPPAPEPGAVPKP
jgi:phage internal scaffolding protein